MKEEAIDKRLKQAIYEAMDTGHKVFVAVLYGSQNYGLDTVDSDIDIRVVVLPTIDEVINRKPMVAGKIDHADGITYITDIRTYINSIAKGSVNFLETLFTEHYVVNSCYLPEWNMLRNYAEDIALMNKRGVISSALGMIRSYEKAVFVESEKNKLTYNPKQLAMMLYYALFLWKYINEEKYINCLKSSNNLSDIKSGKIKISMSEASDLAERCVAYSEKIHKSLTTCNFTQDAELYRKLNKIPEDIITRYIKES